MAALLNDFTSENYLSGMIVMHEHKKILLID